MRLLASLLLLAPFCQAAPPTKKEQIRREAAICDSQTRVNDHDLMLKMAKAKGLRMDLDPKIQKDRVKLVNDLEKERTQYQERFGQRFDLNACKSDETSKNRADTLEKYEDAMRRGDRKAADKVMGRPDPNQGSMEFSAEQAEFIFNNQSPQEILATACGSKEALADNEKLGRMPAETAEMLGKVMEAHRKSLEAAKKIYPKRFGKPLDLSQCPP